MQATIEIKTADKVSKIVGPINDEILAMTAHFPWEKNEDSFFLNGNCDLLQSYKFNIIFQYENNNIQVSYEKVMLENNNVYRINAVRDVLNDLLKNEYRNKSFLNNIETLKKYIVNDIPCKPYNILNQSNVQVSFSIIKDNVVYSINDESSFDLDVIHNILTKEEIFQNYFSNNNLTFVSKKLEVDKFHITQHPELNDFKNQCREKYAIFYAWTKKLCLADSPLVDEICMLAELKRISLRRIFDIFIKYIFEDNLTLDKMFILHFDKNFKYNDIAIQSHNFNLLFTFLSNKDIQMEDIYFLDICCSALFFIENGIHPQKQTVHRFYDTYALFNKAQDLKMYSRESLGIIANIMKKGSFRINAHFSNSLKEDLEMLLTNMPNFKEPIENIRRRYILNSSVNEQTFSFKHMLLNGTPGCGKTLFANELAKINNVAFEVLDFSTITTSFVLSGLDFSWRGGKPGKIFYLLSNQPYFNPLILGDELDKAVTGNHFGSAINCLYTILEKNTAHKFRDEALDIDIDCSGLVWIFTSNGEHAIPKPIISRTNMFHVQDVDGDDKKMIVKNIYQTLRDSSKWGELFSAELDDHVVNIILTYPNREIYTVLENACAHAIEHSDSFDSLITLKESDLIKHKTKPFGFM